MGTIQRRKNAIDTKQGQSSGRSNNDADKVNLTEKPTKQKKDGKKANNRDNSSKLNGGRSKLKRKLNLSEALLFFSILGAVVGLVLHHYYTKYGMNMFLGAGHRDYDWTPYKWRNFIDSQNKTVLLIGGPHRAGTTLVWTAISSHPEVVGFGDRFETGVDYSEGVLFQNVYPRFGVGLEFKTNFGSLLGKKHADMEDFQVNPMGGLGQYALLPESEVHWTKENKQELLNNPTTFTSILNRFGPYWDTNKKYGNKDGLKKAKVWVEKSPQNAVLSLFLEGLYNMPIEMNGSIGTEGTQNATKFLYLTRHPIANCYAHDKFMSEAMGGHLPFEVYLKNYIQLHKYMQMDADKLNSAFLWVRMEDFVRDPAKKLREIFQFLDVPIEIDGVNVVNDIISNIGKINPNPNRKYAIQWCNEGAKRYPHLVEKYDDEIKNLGLNYDLKSFCSSH
mmetsp:Transcript_915/g.1390  ORF Transcript_915/g.1390 Transcript_915/m.1390 type:complete len:447 (+) Transcript_915:130-1470(+)